MRKPELGLTLLIVGMVVLASFALDQVFARQQRFSVGSSWAFQMEGNPSTGYVWRLKEDECENLAIVKVENLGYGAPAADKKETRWSPRAVSFPHHRALARFCQAPFRICAALGGQAGEK